MSRNGGISEKQLAELQEPTRTALWRFSDHTDGRVSFANNEAVRFVRTPEKPNTARTQTTVKFEGRPVGDMFTIVFAGHDGTGDQNTYKLTDVDTGVYPQDAKIIPRSKAATGVEGHLALVSAFEDGTPALLAGNLALLGFGDDRLSRITELTRLGQPISDFTQSLQGERAQEVPITTLTTGNRGVIETGNLTGERFGDPHAVYNPHEVIQVAAFVTDLRVLQALGAVEPQ